jgi:uncharacterized protein YbjQ (UPF0145 family)/F0F1-type ATP synthase membrane subunit c/vacuolar-type H+-ATPase subunit K
MKSFKTAAVAALILGATAGVATSAAAPGQGDVLSYAFQAALQDPKVAAKLTPDVKLFFGDQPAKVVKEIGPTKTNTRGVRPARKTPVSERCVRVAGNALIALANDAKERGGNAVIGIRSHAEGRPTAPQGKFDCVLGLQMVVVNLTGTVVVVE